MRNTPPEFVTEKIKEAIALFMQKNNAIANEPLEYYTDDIFQLTLKNIVVHFLQQNSLRTSEKKTLQELQKDLNEETPLTVTEKRLINNLTKIKPVWGELFGTDRGMVYNTFKALYQRHCFNWQERIYYKEQRELQFKQQLQTYNQKNSTQESQLKGANALIQQHNKTISQLSERATKQFVYIQKLEQKLQKANEKVRQLEKKQKQEDQKDNFIPQFHF